MRPQSVETPASVDELMALVSDSTGRIRPVGSGHSFTPLAHTDGMIIDLSGCGEPVREVHESAATAVVNGGASLRTLSVALDRHHLGFKNLGDIDVQSFAGATSTATHGTGRELPCLAAEILGLHLVTATGELLKIGPDENSDLLPAAQVALGSLGVMVDAAVQLRPAYKLHRRTLIEPLSDTLEAAQQRWADHRNFEFFTLPYCDYAFTITHDETTDPDRRDGQSDDEGSLRDLRWLRSALMRTPWLRRRILNEVARRTETEDVVGVSWEMLASSRETKFNEMEYHLPVDTGLDALVEVIAAVESNPLVYFPVECRRTAADTAWLSPFQGAGRISVAVHIGEGDDYTWLFDVVEPILRKHGGRPPLGKAAFIESP